jgi:hypothetical protein
MMENSITKVLMISALLVSLQAVPAQSQLAAPASDDSLSALELTDALPELPTDADAVIVTVNGKDLTIGMINWIKPNADAATVQQISDFWATTQLLFAEAEKREIPDSAKMQFLAAFSAQQANGHEVVRLVREEATVSEADLDKAFAEKDETDSRTREQIKEGLVGMAQSEAANNFITELKAGATNRVQKSEFLIKMEAASGEQPRL